MKLIDVEAVSRLAHEALEGAGPGASRVLLAVESAGDESRPVVVVVDRETAGGDETTKLMRAHRLASTAEVVVDDARAAHEREERERAQEEADAAYAAKEQADLAAAERAAAANRPGSADNRP